MLDEAVFTAGDLMTRDVAVVHPETSLLDAVKLMARRHLSGMPVVDAKGAIVGMLSEGDLVRWHEGYTDRQARWLDMLAEGFELAPAFLAGIQEQHRKVKSVMAPGATTVTEETPAREVAHLMTPRTSSEFPWCAMASWLVSSPAPTSYGHLPRSWRKNPPLQQSSWRH